MVVAVCALMLCVVHMYILCVYVRVAIIARELSSFGEKESEREKTRKLLTADVGTLCNS